MTMIDGSANQGHPEILKIKVQTILVSFPLAFLGTDTEWRFGVCPRNAGQPYGLPYVAEAGTESSMLFLKATAFTVTALVSSNGLE